MSSGITDNVSERDFWDLRWHYIVDALVSSGLAEVDESAYQKSREELVTQGLPEPLAARVALGTELRREDVPSACEVNPW